MLGLGLVQVYTGDGKGKTTAAMGLALRAAGQGLRVVIFQFLKPPAVDSGERRAMEAWSDTIRIETIDLPWDMTTALSDIEARTRMSRAIEQALDRADELARRCACDVLILDEIVYCLAKGLIRLEVIRHLIQGRDPRVEVVLTGREATQGLIELADLVTEMKAIKHPYDRGVSARQGIEY